MSNKNDRLIDYGRLKRFHTNLKNNDLSKLQGKLTAGNNITISGNTISVTDTYTLPTASSSTKGGVKVGAGLSISNEVLSTIVTPELLIKLLLNPDLISPLTFEATEDNTEITFKGSNINIETSKDGKNWTQYSASTGGTLVGTLNAGEKLFVRGENSSYDRINFLFNKNTYVYGNIMSLIDKNDYPFIYNLTGNNTFRDLFKSNTHLLSHQNKKLCLPATALASDCYSNMFYGCTSLTTAPELPATTLASGCYSAMFNGCTSLTTAPELPATTLVSSCYFEMFRGCTGLTTAPELPATELAYGCYSQMFAACRNLTTIPELPATNLDDFCYANMFDTCTSLTTVPSDLLPASELKESCYRGIFAGCTNLTNAPILHAQTLVPYCYLGMFYQCGKIDYIKCLATNGLDTTYCTKEWVDGVNQTGTFVKHPNMSGWTTGIDGIPTGWVVEDYVPAVKFTAREANSTIGLEKLSIYQTLEYSTDGNNWTNMTTATTISLANSGDKVYIRGVLSNNNSTSNSRHTQFKMTGKIAVSSNCNYLWNYENLDMPLKQLCGYHLFYGCTGLVDASGLTLGTSATTLANACYFEMFYGCSGLTTAPELPTTTVASKCYYSMFNGCSSLTTAPVLPATTLVHDCYNSMFYNCSSLTTAPELPATILAENCYSGMFYNCTSLTTAPELSATTLGNNCYAEMFRGCTGLTTAPELPATTLIGACYKGMFRGCTSLTTAPELPATTLTVNCYEDMFRGCTSLTTAPELPATTLANYCYRYMFYGCTGLTTAPELPATTLGGSCYVSMFKDCTSLTSAPSILPATTLTNGCYYGMFGNCTSLTTAPELPATTLTNDCYFEMFYGCTSLNYVKCLATNISASNCTYTWVNGVSSTGTFVTPQSSNWSTGTSGIPSGWTRVDSDAVSNA